MDYTLHVRYLPLCNFMDFVVLWIMPQSSEFHLHVILWILWFCGSYTNPRNFTSMQICGFCGFMDYVSDVRYQPLCNFMDFVVLWITLSISDINLSAILWILWFGGCVFMSYYFATAVA